MRSDKTPNIPGCHDRSRYYSKQRICSKLSPVIASPIQLIPSTIPSCIQPLFFQCIHWLYANFFTHPHRRRRALNSPSLSVRAIASTGTSPVRTAQTNYPDAPPSPSSPTTPALWLPLRRPPTRVFVSGSRTLPLRGFARQAKVGPVAPSRLLQAEISDPTPQSHTSSSTWLGRMRQDRPVIANGTNTCTIFFGRSES